MKGIRRALLLAVCLVMIAGVLPGSAMGEAVADKAFEPFEEPVKVKVVMGYSEASKPGVLPSTCAWNDVLKEYLNIELDWMWEVPSDQYDTKLSVALASGEYPDMLQCSYDVYSYLLESEALKDLSGIWEEYASKPLKDAFAAAGNDPMGKVTVDGKLMAVPYATDLFVTMVANFYRSDWLKNVGLEVPTNLDELTAVIKAFRDQDPDGNGEKDTYAFGAYSDIFTTARGGLTSLFNTFNAYPNSWIEKDGKIVNGSIQDETKEALDWLRGLYAEGYIDPEFATFNRDQFDTKVADSKTGIIGGVWSSGDDVLNSIKNCKTATWTVGPVIGKNAGDTGRSVASEKTISKYNVVLSTASDEAAIAMIKMLNMFFDFNFYTEEGISGWPWWNRVNAPGSEEYEAVNAKWYAWWLPVNIWDPNGTLNQYKAATELYRTGYFSTYISLGNEEANRRWKDWGEYIRKDRSEMQTKEEDDTWCTSFVRCLTRITTDEIGPCSTELLYNQQQAGNYVLNVFYGSETETGVAVASTLKDYVTQYFCNYIMGNKPEDSWQEFVDGWLAMGGETWTEEVNEAYNRTH